MRMRQPCATRRSSGCQFASLCSLHSATTLHTDSLHHQYHNYLFIIIINNMFYALARLAVSDWVQDGSCHEQSSCCLTKQHASIFEGSTQLQQRVVQLECKHDFCKNACVVEQPCRSCSSRQGCSCSSGRLLSKSLHSRCESALTDLLAVCKL